MQTRCFCVLYDHIMTVETRITVTAGVEGTTPPRKSIGGPDPAI